MVSHGDAVRRSVSWRGKRAFDHVDLGRLDIGEDMIASVLVALGEHLAFVENFEIELLTLAGAGGVRSIALLRVPARSKIHLLVQHRSDLRIKLIEVRIVDPGGEEIEVIPATPPEPNGPFSTTVTFKLLFAAFAAADIPA